MSLILNGLSASVPTGCGPTRVDVSPDPTRIGEKYSVCALHSYQAAVRMGALASQAVLAGVRAVAPHQGPVVPARAMYSHSASVGSR